MKLLSLGAMRHAANSQQKILDYAKCKRNRVTMVAMMMNQKTEKEK